MMQAGYLVLLLLATSAASATTSAESASQLRVAKDFDSYETEGVFSEEEHNKRSLFNWLSKSPTEYDKTIVEQEIVEVEVPVKEDVIVRLPTSVEVPLPERPYSVELRLSVPESNKSPITFHVPYPEVYRPVHVEKLPAVEVPALHYSLPKKPEFWPSNPFFFNQPVKTEIIESSPVVTEITEIKTPLDVQIVEEDIYIPDAYPFGKIGYPHESFLAKPNPTKVVVEESVSYFPYEEERIIKTHPLPQPLPTFIEKPIVSFEEERIIKTHPQPIYHPKPLPTFIEKPIVSFEEERIIKTHPSPIYHPKPLPTFLEKPIVSFEEERIIKTHPQPIYHPKPLPTFLEKPIVSFEEERIIKTHPQPIYHPKPLPTFIEKPLVSFEEERIIKTHPSPFYHPKPLPTLVQEPIASFDWVNIPYEKEKIFKTHPSTVYYSQSPPNIIKEPALVGGPFNKFYTGKTQFGSFGPKIY